MTGISVKPWIGPHFQSTRLLLLGESAYSWKNKEGEVVHPSAEHPSEQVRYIVAHFDDPDQRFMRMLSRALANEERPSPERLKCVWDRVAFTNFVPESVGIRDEAAALRPTSEQWERGKAEFPALLERVRPLRMIVLGEGTWSHLPPAVNEGAGAMFFELSSGELCWCQPLNHPRAELSWRQLAAATYFAFAVQLRAPTAPPF